METVPDPIAAATHPDPYPFYADLVAHRPVHRSPVLGLWVVAGAEGVHSVLQEGRCRVRPAAEPVPRWLLGSPAGEVFRRLVRMTDGPRHAPLKRAFSTTLDKGGGDRVAAQSRASARVLVDELCRGHITLREVAFQMPIHVIGTLLGLGDRDLVPTVRRVDALVCGFAPGANAEQVAEAGRAAEELLLLFTRLAAALPPETLLGRLREQAGSGDLELVAANGIGMLTQGYEATAGLIGNALLALAEHAEVRERISEDPRLFRHLLLEVARHDPPVQNTRRWMAADACVAGQEMKEGEGILVVLAAANRDSAANPDPHRLDIDRPHRRSFTFGFGSHGCPGETMAITIAEAALAELARAPGGLPAVRRPVAYRPSTNCRIPLL